MKDIRYLQQGLFYKESSRNPINFIISQFSKIFI